MVDIRLTNNSHLASFARRAHLPYLLNKICRANYLYRPELAPTKEIRDDFRWRRIPWTAYAAEFSSLMQARDSLSKLKAEVRDRDCLLCACKSYEHCHRILVSNWLQENSKDIEVVHL